jgi:hypothetical protein
VVHNALPNGDGINSTFTIDVYTPAVHPSNTVEIYKLMGSVYRKDYTAKIELSKDYLREELLSILLLGCQLELISHLKLYIS